VILLTLRIHYVSSVTTLNGYKWNTKPHHLFQQLEAAPLCLVAPRFWQPAASSRLSPLTCLLVMRLQVQGNNEEWQHQASTYGRFVPVQRIEWNEQLGVSGEHRLKQGRSHEETVIGLVWVSQIISQCEREIGNANFFRLKNHIYILCSYNGIN
jgi:hypothetical protein